MEAPARLAQEAKGIYLYCLFSGKGPLLEGMKGLDGEELFLLAYRDLKALVSYVPLSQYNEEALSQRLQDPEWVASRVQHHQEAIQYIANLQPAVPLKFCTIFKTKEKVLELLRDHHQKLSSFLRLIRDKEEWGLKVYAREGRVKEAAGKDLEGKPSSILPGEAYLLSKKREARLRDQGAGLVDQLSNEIYQQLRPWCEEIQRNRPWGKQATGRGQEMILNAALLLKRGEVGRFKAKLNRLADNYEEPRLLFEISGPWPPFNFCPNLEADLRKVR